MSSFYPVVVIGGGPAGTIAAWKAAQYGVEVLLIERDREIGLPVRCAEMCALKTIERYLTIPDRLIANRIIEEEIISPDNKHTILHTPGQPTILERKLFDAYLAELARNAGAAVMTCSDAVGMRHTENGYEIDINSHGNLRQIEAGIIIAADGVESRVARWAGINTALALNDLYSAVQYNLTNLNIENYRHSYYYFGNSIAPGGFAWVFPKNGEHANVGIGILASKSNGTTAKYYLDRFIQKYFPGARHIDFVAGGVPAALPLKEIAADNLLIAGDAARLVNPISGAGIGNAVISGIVAGEVAGRAVQKKQFGKKFLKIYSRLLFKEIGQHLKLLYRISKVLQHIEDEEFCRVNQLARDCGPDLNIHAMCRILVRNDPKLLLEMPKLFLRT